MQTGLLWDALQIFTFGEYQNCKSEGRPPKCPDIDWVLVEKEGREDA